MDVRNIRRAAVLVVVLAGPAAAQSLADSGAVPASPPLTLSFTEGRVEIARATGVAPAQTPDLVDDGDRLIVGAGRAELVADDGTLYHLDHTTDAHVGSGVRLRLVRGRVVVHAPPSATTVAIATPAGLVHLEPRSACDLSADDLDGDTVVRVIDGRAALAAGDTEWPLGAGDVLRVDPRTPIARWSANLADDAFLTWSRRRADRATLARAAATLPPGVQPWAADFAQSGQWATVAEAGVVWFPTVGPGWRPYSLGTWRPTRRGWTWIDDTHWGWPVHHYGRWGRTARGWYWIPQRTWGPAWVRWSADADRIGWAPLGPTTASGVSPAAAGAAAVPWSYAPRRQFMTRRTERATPDGRVLPGPVAGGFLPDMIGPRPTPDGPDRFAVRPPPAASDLAGDEAARNRVLRRRVDDPPVGAETLVGRPRRAIDAPAPSTAGEATGRAAAPAGPERSWSAGHPLPGYSVVAPPPPSPGDLRRAPAPVGPPQPPQSTHELPIQPGPAVTTTPAPPRPSSGTGHVPAHPSAGRPSEAAPARPAPRRRG